MNKVVLMGRLVRDPEVRYTQSEKPTCVSRYSLAVQRRFHRDGDPDTDFINCVAFGKNGEFAEKYLHQGMRIVVCGRIQTGSYTNKDGQKIYTTDVLVEEHEFAESKSDNATDTAPKGNSSNSKAAPSPMDDASDGFMNLPDGIDDELPFN